MLSSTLPTKRFYIFGVNAPDGHTLLIDYSADDPDRNGFAVLERIRRSADGGIADWRERERLGVADVFGIESVGSQQAAQLAVEFWRAYFRALGEIVIEASHLPDSPV
ncbi:hypothetical protein [Paraburkholderia humisilvae]|uniref:Uncharacterized protein n=1 Tax=Paraburkholderia humisilvae TaxID=627669 RepID=A0A6J5EK02_9BURK|nr:hypothetical protein [Paraburkholderia humisilvae]CAB3765781.1 hypothetical protein LMG29542_05229 [Paraburkholderia humisilvae]